MSWIRFFLGTPRRFLVTVLFIVFLGAVHYFAPGTIHAVALGLVRELNPIISAVIYYGLILGLVYLGFRVMIAPFLRGGRGGRSRR